MKKYNCPNCSAELYWDAGANALKCEYCEHEYQPEELDALETENETALQSGEKTVREADAGDRVTDESEKTDTKDLVVYACKNCGAEVITSRSTIATTCAFCGRAISLTDKMVGEFKPDCVIPFSIDEDRAREIYKSYSKKGVLSPREFRDKNQIKKLKGVYVPFWLHSFTENAGVIVNAENTMSHKRGNDKVIEHHMFEINMRVSADFESIPADGLVNLDNDLMSSIEPFDYSKLTDFSPAFMAGYYAEEYDDSAQVTAEQAHERSKKVISDNAVSQAGLFQTKLVSGYSSAYKDEISKYAMLPVWLLNVDYKDKNYQFAINGETGKISGKLPISKLKVAALTAGSIFGTQLIALLIRLITY